MYSVIDIGSNTIRLVIYKIVDNKVISFITKKEAAGLAGCISQEGRLDKRGENILVNTLLDFRDILSVIDTHDDFIFATASLRNITNSDEVLRMIKKATGYDVDIISGEEEATLDYYGAKKYMTSADGLMIDIGGGSTELAFYQNHQLLDAISVPVGSLNMFNTYVAGIIPTPKEIQQIQKHMSDILNQIPQESINDLCGVGGSVRVLLKYLKTQKKYNITTNSYDAVIVNAVCDMAHQKPDKFTRQILKVAPDRIHTFIPGLIILNTIVTYFDIKTITTSSNGVREGYLYKKLEARGIISDT